MTCERVVIINQGRVVAEDTPDALTARLQGSQVLSVTVDGPAESVRSLINSHAGTARVEPQPGDEGTCTYSIETVQGQDIRRDLARSIIEANYGLLELKQMGMSLEDIYLQLTTSEESEVEPTGAPESEETQEEESH